MSRIHFDSNCDSCGPVVILEGNPMKCPKCGLPIEVKPIVLERESPVINTEVKPIGTPDTPPPSSGKEILRG